MRSGKILGTTHVIELIYVNDCTKSYVIPFYFVDQNIRLIYSLIPASTKIMGFHKKIISTFLSYHCQKFTREKNDTFRNLTDVYTCLIPWVNVKYSQERSYACQGGSMLRNISPGTAGTMSPK